MLLYGYYYYLNDTELLSRATDADYLIYQGNFSAAYVVFLKFTNTTIFTQYLCRPKSLTVNHLPQLGRYETKRSVLKQIKAVQNKDVFDTWGRGSNDWYESRTAEPDVFLEVGGVVPDL